jgi:hypothetical protein
MTNENPEERRRTLRQKILIGIGLLSAAVILFSMGLAFFYPISSLDDLPALLRCPPSDEEMIANFRKHREEFERLADIYRADLSVPTYLSSLVPTPEIKAIMERINVDSVTGDREIWMPPDPYSKEPDFLRNTARLQAKGPIAETRKFSGVILRNSQGRVISRTYGHPVYKQYYYYPFVPVIRNGKPIRPVASLKGFPRLVPTLDTYPPDFKPGDCVCRQIEPHWFIEMCQGDN